MCISAIVSVYILISLYLFISNSLSLSFSNDLSLSLLFSSYGFVSLPSSPLSLSLSLYLSVYLLFSLHFDSLSKPPRLTLSLSKPPPPTLSLPSLVYRRIRFAFPIHLALISKEVWVPPPTPRDPPRSPCLDLLMFGLGISASSILQTPFEDCVGSLVAVSFFLYFCFCCC